jgi:predicted secreted protein
MKTFALVLSFLGFLNSAHAGDQYTFHNLGFSNDGKYFAYGVSAIQDGSGYGVATVQVKEVLNYDNGQHNVIANTYLEEGSAEEALQGAMKSINFANFNLAPGSIPGVPSSPSTTNTAKILYAGNHYTLTLSTEATKVPDYCFEDNKGYSRIKVELTKTDANGRSETEQIYFEYTPPAERICAYEYQIAQVIQYGDKVALLISYSSTGFEGPNSEFVIIPAVLR